MIKFKCHLFKEGRLLHAPTDPDHNIWACLSRMVTKTLTRYWWGPEGRAMTKIPDAVCVTYDSGLAKDPDNL